MLTDSWQRAVLSSIGYKDPKELKSDRLIERLARLRSLADAYKDLPLRPDSENEVGCIDSIYISSEGRICFVGWIKRGIQTEFSAVIVDRQKYTAGATTVQFERQDLASSCVGVIGIMDTGWTPPLISRELFIYFGEGAKLQVRLGVRTEVLRAAQFFLIWRQAQSVSLRGENETIGLLLETEAEWLPGSPNASGLEGDGGVDRIFVMPGFGCVVEGWAITYGKRTVAFEMKIGESLLEGDSVSTYFKPRPDLAPVLGAQNPRIAQAGFVTVVRGPLPSTVSGSVLLRVIHEDGSSLVHRVDSKRLQLLDPVADSTEILRLYPGIRQEAFYPAFLEAVHVDISRRAREPIAISIAASERLLVIRLPGNRNNVALAFENIADQLPLLRTGIGVCLLADRSEELGDIKSRFEELRSITSVPLSMFFVEYEDEGFDALPFVLVRLKSKRFAYVGRGLLLTARGWEHVERSLDSSENELCYFEIIDESGGPDRIFGSRSAACLGWSLASFLDWMPNAPRFVRGIHLTNGLPESGRLITFDSAAIRIERPKNSLLADLIDNDLLVRPGSSSRAL
jgi:hypothetical protein